MKRCLSILLLMAALALPALAQDEAQRGIKVTSTLHDDGTRTDMQKDFDNLTAESKTYGPNNKLIQRGVYTINEQGNILEGAVYDAKGKVGARIAFTYDEQGRTQEQFDQAPDGTLLRRLVYHYDVNGRVSGIEAYDGRGNPLQSGGGASTPAKKKRPPARK